MIKEITIQPNQGPDGQVDKNYLRVAMSYTTQEELIELSSTLEGKKKMYQDQLDLLKRAYESAKKVVKEYSTVTEEQFQKDKEDWERIKKLNSNNDEN